MNGKIEYGFGKEYLSNWTLIEALREVFQNYIDYGEYEINTYPTEYPSELVHISISNDYNPEKLEFLRIGNSYKGDNNDAIGKHGEGLKMAFLIFLREQLNFKIWTSNYVLSADWSQDDLIGETLRIEYCPNVSTVYDSKWKDKFVTEFDCPKDIYDEFVNTIITPKDVIYHNSVYGDVLHIATKGKGNIYSGNLFVCHIEGIESSYNIKSSQLPLDRDRSVPREFDLDYAISRLNEGFREYRDKLAISVRPYTNYSSREYKFIHSIPNEEIDNYKLTKVGKAIEVIDKITGTILKNDNIKKAIINHPKFKKEISLSHRVVYLSKQRMAYKKSVKALLKTFKKNYCKSQEEIDDINIIINRV